MSKLETTQKIKTGLYLWTMTHYIKNLQKLITNDYPLEQIQNPYSDLTQGQEVVAQAPQDQMLQKSNQKRSDGLLDLQSRRFTQGMAKLKM